MKIMTFECMDEKREKWLVKSIENHIAKVDKECTVEVNYFTED